MGLIQQAQEDIAEITSNPDEWGVEITLTAPDLTTATLNGTHSKHHLAIGEKGERVNSRSAYISFSESNLLAANQEYPIRNESKIVNLKDHQVKVKDSTGIEFTYAIREWYPDETVGLIVCILGDYDI